MWVPCICICGHFGPNIRIFGPFGPMSNQKTIRTRYLGGFFVTWEKRLLLPSVRIRIFGPKKAKVGPKYVFWAQIGLAGSFGAP